MTNCPHCGASISQPDLQIGKCSACSRELSAAGSGPAPAEQSQPTVYFDSHEQPSPTLGTGCPPPVDEKRTVDWTRIEATVQFQPRQADSSAEVPLSSKKTAGADEIAKTMGIAPPGQPANKLNLTDDRRVAATYDSDNIPEPTMGTWCPDPTMAERRLAATYDSKDLAEDSASKVSMAWPSKFDEGSTPRTSIKADGPAVHEEANLNIHSRILRAAGTVYQESAPGNDRLGIRRDDRPDYELLSELGKGGMGIVHNARQASIDRTVALKKIKPEKAREPTARRTFLSEAVVTGDLEHPNIVPIYDMGEDDAGALFYVMKRVRGTPWDKVIAQKSFDENLEIWMKVADAVAFAHSRGVVHRDLKPENVMLGAFGEVLLMDWGLAIVLHSPAAKKAGMAGTPAYMPPEMAMGPVSAVGIHSDIYLMGAILYEIITGRAPHTGSTVTACLMSAAKNEIVPAPKKGELVEIALMAMSATPEGRYASMVAFQDAIRQYRSHSESISLSARADEDLLAAAERSNYDSYSRALFGFQEAYELWEGNTRAKNGILETTLAYATRAKEKGDYDLGASLLDEKIAEHGPLLKEIREAQRERDARQQRLKTARRIGIALMVTVIVVVSVAFVIVQGERDKAKASEARAVAEKDEADRQRTAADIAKADAVEKKEEADRQRTAADLAKADAVAKKIEADRQRTAADIAKADALAKKKEAEDAKKAEEYGAYIARIGLAAAKIEENAFDRARAILQECPPPLRNWEWGRLSYLCDRAVRNIETGQRIEAVAYSPDGKRFAASGWGGSVNIWNAGSKPLLTITSGANCIFALAFSPDGRHLAAGTNDRHGFIKIWDTTTGGLMRTLLGHSDAVLSIAWSRDGKRLLSGSYDRTAILWDLESGATKTFKGHEDWVYSVAFAPPARPSEKETRIVTASQDGTVMVWSIATQKADAPFQGHAGPVYAARFSPDGRFVASAGYDKRVLLWRPEDVKPFDYEVLRSDRDPPPPIFESLEAHTAGVSCLDFSPNGKLLASGGNDNAVCVWDVEKYKLLKTLRGHAGRVRSLAFAPQLQDVEAQLLTGGHDQSVKQWNLKDYEEFRVFGAPVFAGHQDAVLGASFSPDNRAFISASRDRTARIWNLTTGASRHLQQGHEYLATAAVFFCDGKRFITAAADDTTRIWDVETGMNVVTIRETGSSGAAAISFDETSIFTGGKNPRTFQNNPTAEWQSPPGENYAAKLWDARSGKLVRAFPMHQAEITAVAISRDGRYVFAGDAQGCCTLWEKSGNLVWENKAGHIRDVKAAAFLPDGRRVLTASSDHTVLQWDVATGQSNNALNLRHPDAVTSLALSGDGRRAVTTCADQVVRLWDVERAVVLKSEAGKSNETFNTVQFSPDARWIVTTSTRSGEQGAGSREQQATQRVPGGEQPSSSLLPAPGSRLFAVRVRDTEDLKEVAGQAGIPALLANINSGRGNSGTERAATIWTAVFTPRGDGLLTVGGDQACLWDVATAREKMVFNRQGAIASARYSPDGERVVTSSWDKAARIWNAVTGLPERMLLGHASSVNDAAFSPDGKSIVTASNDKTAILWDAASGRLLHTYRGHTAAVYRAVLFQTADGAMRLVTASQDGTVRIWDVESEKTLAVLDGHHQRAVLAIAVSRDGSRMLTGGEDNVATLWSLARDGGQALFRLEGHTAAVTSVDFSPDGSRAITGSRDDTAKLWELQGGKELLTLRGHSQEVTTVAFSGDGKNALTGSADGTIVVWPSEDWRTPSPASREMAFDRTTFTAKSQGSLRLRATRARLPSL
jgi:WD40 repeat protein